jgi:hypothetical protein
MDHVGLLVVLVYLKSVEHVHVLAAELRVAALDVL